MISRTYPRHFASCLDCHMLYIWTTLKPWKTLSTSFKEWCSAWERTNSHQNCKVLKISCWVRMQMYDWWHLANLTCSWVDSVVFLLFTKLRHSTQIVSTWVHQQVTRGCRCTYIHSHICEIDCQSLPSQVFALVEATLNLSACCVVFFLYF